MAHIIAFHKTGEVRIEQLRNEINMAASAIDFEFPQMAIQWREEYIEIEDIDDIVTNHTPEIKAVVDAHVPTLTYFESEVDEVKTDNARTGWRDLGDWATWTPQEAELGVRNLIFDGTNLADLEAWIDTSITGTTVAQLRTQLVAALKIIVREIVTIRTVLAIVAKVAIYIRDILIKRL